MVNDNSLQIGYFTLLVIGVVVLVMGVGGAKRVILLGVEMDLENGQRRAVLIWLGIAVCLVSFLGLFGKLDNSLNSKANPPKALPSSSPAISPSPAASSSSAVPTVAVVPPTTAVPGPTPPAGPSETAGSSPSIAAEQLSPTQQLSAIAESDRATVETTLLNHWVPQVASGVVGLRVGSQTMTADFLLRRHLGLKRDYGAVLLYTKGFAYKHQDYWASVVPLTFSRGDGALSWCREQSIGADNCFAVLLTHDRSTKVTAKYQ